MTRKKNTKRPWMPLQKLKPDRPFSYLGYTWIIRKMPGRRSRYYVEEITPNGKIIIITSDVSLDGARNYISSEIWKLLM